MTIHKFIFDSMALSQKKQWAYGTCVMLILRSEKPDLWAAALDKQLTVAHMSGPAENPERWDRFFDYIERNWYGVPS